MGFSEGYTVKGQMSFDNCMKKNECLFDKQRIRDRISESCKCVVVPNEHGLNECVRFGRADKPHIGYILKADKIYFKRWQDGNYVQELVRDISDLETMIKEVFDNE